MMARLSFLACLIVLALVRSAHATCADSCDASIIDAACQPIELTFDEDIAAFVVQLSTARAPIGFVGSCSSCCGGDWQCQDSWYEYYETELACMEEAGARIPKQCSETALAEKASTLVLSRDDGTIVDADFVAHSCPGAVRLTETLEDGVFTLTADAAMVLRFGVAHQAESTTTDEPTTQQEARQEETEPPQNSKTSDEVSVSRSGCQLTGAPSITSLVVPMLLLVGWLWRRS